jgi:rod shape determining protein RodA
MKPSTIVAGLWRQQLLWFALAMLVTPLILRVPVIWLEWASQPIYALCLILLLLTLFVGTGAGTAQSVSGWIGVGPVRVQPAEVAKIGGTTPTLYAGIQLVLPPKYRGPSSRRSKGTRESAHR